MRARIFPLALMALPLTACTGFSLGENNPGGDTYLEYGAVAVDDRTETVLLMTEQVIDEKTQETQSLLRAVSPDSGEVTTVTDLSDRDDARVLFPKSGALVMSEQGGKDELRLFDNKTFEEKLRVEMPVRYHGTRSAPSREWIAVADNTSEHAPIHILDAENLTARVIPHNGDWLEAMWKNQTDELFAIVFYDGDSDDDGKQDYDPYARILSWSMADVTAGQFEPDDTGFWPKRKLDINVPLVGGDFLFSFTWVGISPNDKYAVFPVQDLDPETPETYALLVVNTETGELRRVADAKGPVGFTPDGSTIVSYDDKGSENGPDGTTKDGEIDQRLLLIDVETLEVDPQDVDISGGLSYFISRDGNFVVVASNFADEKLVLYDIDNSKQTQMQGPAIGLEEFVSRRGHNELWLVDQTSLYQLDMNEGTLLSVNTGYDVSHLNILPKHDWLVLSEAPRTDTTLPRIHFYDPEAMADVKAVDMPEAQ